VRRSLRDSRVHFVVDAPIRPSRGKATASRRFPNSEQVGLRPSQLARPFGGREFRRDSLPNAEREGGVVDETDYEYRYSYSELDVGT